MDQFNDSLPPLRQRLCVLWRLYRVPALILVVWTIGAWMLFEAWRPVTRGSIWTARAAVWTAVLLVDNLLLVFWYAHSTRSVLLTAQTQVEVSRQQLTVFRAQQEESRQPCVVIDRRVLTTTGERSSPAETAVFEAHNIGRGFAVNLTYVELPNPGTWQNPTNIGGLGAGASFRLPGRVEHLLRHGPPLTGHLIIAEGYGYGGAKCWVATVNVIDRQGDISHAVIMAEQWEASDARQFLANFCDQFDGQFSMLRAELDRRGS